VPHVADLQEALPLAVVRLKSVPHVADLTGGTALCGGLFEFGATRC